MTMKGHCVFRAVQAKKLSDTILTDLVDPLKDLLKAQVIANKTQESLLFRSLKELRCYKDQTSKARFDYEQQFKEIEDLVVQIESAGSPIEKKKMLSMQTEDLNWRLEKATKAYRDAVKKYNGCLVEHQEELSTALNRKSAYITPLPRCPVYFPLTSNYCTHCDLTTRMEVSRR